MGMLKRAAIPLAVLFMLGCSAGPSPPPQPSKTVFDPMTQQLDRARDVQKTVDANTDATRKAVDEQEHGDSSP